MIAIIGSNGQLGWELVRRAERRGYEALSLDFPERKPPGVPTTIVVGARPLGAALQRRFLRLLKSMKRFQ